METLKNVTEQTKWTLDPSHSELTFKVKHLMISNVKGEFRKFDVEMEGSDLENATVKVTVDAESISTNSPDRDGHLKSADFFEVETFPELTFIGTTVQKVDEGEYKLTGLLTIKGIAKRISLDVEYGGLMTDPYGNIKSGYSVSGKFNRKDWGLNWNAALEAGGVMVSDEVKVNAEIQLVKG